MMPTTCNEQAPVPPPSYSRAQVQAQAQHARALHTNALTLIQTLHPAFLVPLGRSVGPSALSSAVTQGTRWCAAHLPRRVEAHDRFTQNPSSGSPIKTCMTGWEAGLPWRWPVACRRELMARHTFPVLPNCVSEGLQQAYHPLKPSSC